jgi:hypothetical protein
LTHTTSIQALITNLNSGNTTVSELPEALATLAATDAFHIEYAESVDLGRAVARAIPPTTPTGTELMTSIAAGVVALAEAAGADHAEKIMHVEAFASVVDHIDPVADFGEIVTLMAEYVHDRNGASTDGLDQLFISRLMRHAHTSVGNTDPRSTSLLRRAVASAKVAWQQNDYVGADSSDPYGQMLVYLASDLIDLSDPFASPDEFVELITWTDDAWQLLSNSPDSKYSSDIAELQVSLLAYLGLCNLASADAERLMNLSETMIESLLVIRLFDTDALLQLKLASGCLATKALTAYEEFAIVGDLLALTIQGNEPNAEELIEGSTATSLTDIGRSIGALALINSSTDDDAVDVHAGYRDAVARRHATLSSTVAQTAIKRSKEVLASMGPQDDRATAAVNLSMGLLSLPDQSAELADLHLAYRALQSFNEDKGYEPPSSIEVGLRMQTAYMSGAIAWNTATSFDILALEHALIQLTVYAETRSDVEPDVALMCWDQAYAMYVKSFEMWGQVAHRDAALSLLKRTQLLLSKDSQEYERRQSQIEWLAAYPGT